jgi:hypothetical protein
VREYEIYVPLSDNAGRPIDPAKIEKLKRWLVERFGGLTHFPQENEGLWRVGRHTFRDRIVIIRVVASDTGLAERIFSQLKEDLKRDWNQEDVLIIARDISVL